MFWSAADKEYIFLFLPIEKSAGFSYNYMCINAVCNMRCFMNFIYERIEQMLSRIYPLTKRAVYPIDGFECAECGYKTSETPDEELVYRPWTKNDRFGGKEEWHGWYRGIVKVPDCPEGCSLELENYYDDGQNPQYLVYLDGKLVQGTDKNHVSVPLDPTHSEYDVKMYVYTGYDELDYKFEPKVVVRDDEVTGLYYDIRVPFEVLSLMDKTSREYMLIRDGLNEALNILDWRTPGSPEFLESVRAARAYLSDEVYGMLFCEEGRDGHPNVACIGHTHIDVAWLWTYAQTREKVQRSFSTVISLMQQYPEYKFMSSQPQLYKYLKEDSPETYEKIKTLVAEGRWEPEGAMWVEADTNLAGGEALIRQILYGKKFFRDEFGVESHVLWLPDVFGYSAAMPQILRKSNVDKFVTSKISWNETNMMPHDVFDWQGIDGSKVFSYFITSQKTPASGMARYTTYNSDITPSYVNGAWNRLQEKELSREVLNPFGFGDGGGGPTKKMLEYGRRMSRGIGSCPTVTQKFAGQFLDELEENARKTGKMPSWVGELYLEYHRGTYTSNAKNKKNNRRSEFLYMNAEALSVMDKLLTGAEYPRDEIMHGWETLLLNQFHDVLPGSSIKPVYDDTDVMYADIIGRGEVLTSKIRGKVAGMVAPEAEKALFFNSNGFDASGIAVYNGERVYVENVPSKGYGLLAYKRGHCGADADMEARILENEHIRVVFTPWWEIESIYDKNAKRSVLSGIGNRLLAHEDFPRAYDAWEITNYYKEKAYLVNEVSAVEAVDFGAEVGFRITRNYQSSVIVQTITISPYDKAVKIHSDVDWHERHTLLKAYFPVAVNADTATYEIQYGHVKRPTHENTSWDAAKFEVCAHKYADISEYGYGASILNDCKYGYSCSGTEMALTLLKCATHPNPEADQGKHEFTYVFLPHEGDFRDAGIVDAAYLLNQPIVSVDAMGDGAAPASMSLVKTDRKNVIVEAVKAAEDDDNAVIARIYDAHNMRSTVNVTVGFDAARAYVCDMEENELYGLPCLDNTVEIGVGPFEIVTLKFYKK